MLRVPAKGADTANNLHPAVFRNENSDGHLGAVSQLITQSFGGPASV